MGLMPQTPDKRNYFSYLNAYAITDTNMAQVSQKISTHSAFDFQYWFNDPSQALLSLRYYPLNVLDVIMRDTLGLTTTTMEIGAVSLDTPGVSIIRNGDPRSNFIDFGSIDVYRHFNDFRDFSPYTKAHLYVPFFGWFDLPMYDLYTGPTVKLSMVIDVLTGYANVYVISYTSAAQQHVICQQGKKIAIDVPITLNDSGEQQTRLLQNIYMGSLSMAGGILGGASTGGVGGAIAGGVTGVINTVSKAVQDYNVHYNMTGSFSTFASLYDPLSAFVKFERVPDDTQITSSVVGLPLNQIKTLSTLSGFTQVSNVNVTLTSQMTQTEADEIESLLHQGVIL